jgi:hypothetical protein
MIRRDAWREYSRGSLWVLPLGAVVLALVLGALLSRVRVPSGSLLAFQGTADDARSLLISISGTMVTVIALLLGLAVVALMKIAGAGEGHRDRGLPSTMEGVITVFVTAMVLVAVMFVVVVAALALAARAHHRRQLEDARAGARHWVERLGGELLLLDGAAARLGTGRAAGLGEAAERFTAAGAELAAARTPRQCRIAQDTAVEGLHHVRTARRSLRLIPGPRVPGQSVGGALLAALQDGVWSVPKLVDNVLAEAHGRARQLPAATIEPAEWIRQGQQRWMRPESVGR